MRNPDFLLKKLLDSHFRENDGNVPESIPYSLWGWNNKQRRIMEKVDLIIRGDYVLPMEGDLPVIKDGAVAVTGKKIIDVGIYTDISKKYNAEKILEGEDKVVFPGLINTHTHAAMVYFRGLADDLPLQEWLQNHIWPAESKWLTKDFVGDAVELACLEMLKAGVATYTDMYFYQDTAVEKL